MISNKTIFITGGAGFIANKLIAKLVNTNQIVVNLGHNVAGPPLKTRDGKHYHTLRVIATQVAKFVSRDGKISVEDAFDRVDQLFDDMSGADIYDFKTPQTSDKLDGEEDNHE